MSYTSTSGPFDVITSCAQSDFCDKGELLVNQMMTVYKSGFNSSRQDEFISKFSVNVNAIKTTFDELDDSIWIRTLNQKCCTMLEIGTQAQAVTTQMLSFLGKPNLVQLDTSKPETGLAKAAKTFDTLKLVLLGVAGIWAYSKFRK